MRSNIALFEKSMLIAVATYVIFLGYQENLDLYIHPRYVLFTIVLSVVGLAVVLLGTRGTQSGTTKRAAMNEDHAYHTHGEKLKPADMLLLTVVAVAILLPARTLTSSTVSQRSVDSGSIVSVDSEPVETLFSSSSRGLGLGDWARLLETNDNPSYYQNRPADISGFVYDAGLGSNTLFLSRFVVICCTVDAQPIGVPLHVPSWRATYEEDQWLAVEGSFELRMTDQGEQLVLVPETITPIDEPKDPYGN